jgi:beta-carotene ketolase (CrtW type)
MENKYSNLGIVIALIIISFWSISLALLLNIKVDFKSPITYIFILLQTHLYTGLFITAHDAMHGVVSENKRLNHFIGFICSNLFAFNNYSKLYSKHHLHHEYPVSEKDPDYYNGSFFSWYFKFVIQYLTILQFILMSILFNIMQLFFKVENIYLYWIIPSILSTLQLFYFGTYLPHKGTHEIENKHKARSQNKNDIWAFISCYFFGYHYEHHAYPYLPWWKLKDVKNS